MTTGERILDLLEAEQGWVNQYEIAERLDLPHTTVSKAISRLRAAGAPVVGRGKDRFQMSEYRLEKVPAIF